MNTFLDAMIAYANVLANPTAADFLCGIAIGFILPFAMMGLGMLFTCCSEKNSDATAIIGLTLVLGSFLPGYVTAILKWGTPISVGALCAAIFYTLVMRNEFKKRDGAV